ncbi:MAG: deoxyribodipyrimidine photo-lyase [Rhodobiaceae bacterium]|nr:deoxyribodipyrimidine photo-lyase [Rhodobiaceae bacterium]MCC0047947.1 deoxyribodipyrimidine photo-lyase [Rhodobiaceae bacterium]
MTETSKGPAIVWFREDLRLEDNPALAAAAECPGGIIALYVLDEETEGLRSLGGASRWWLHHSLNALCGALRDKGVRLVLRRGKVTETVLDAAREAGAAQVHWNRRYSPGEIESDKAAKQALKDAGIETVSHPGNLLIEPWQIETGNGDPYKVFTPFWKAARQKGWRTDLIPAPKSLTCAAGDMDSEELEDWDLLPGAPEPDWAKEFGDIWQPGESGARERLKSFLDGGIDGYANLRDRPDRENTSRLSPHLRFGEITPHTIASAVSQARDAGDVSERDADKFLSEVGWREFSYNLLYNFPKLPQENLQSKFDGFPWKDDADGLKAWRKGMTGYPIVDAGMRELWRLGTMHNRVRMIVASFLIKDLMIHWREGEAWFWDTLVDADHANNAASWQWVAGSGADAAPFFRIFNPILQGEKHDPKGDYVRMFVPELAGLPDKYIHKPWEAPGDVLDKAGITLGQTYPQRIVDHAKARDRALSAFKSLGKGD